MKNPLIIAAFIVSMAIMLFTDTHANATVGATVPFTEYEAEAGTLASGATVVSLPIPVPSTGSPAREASGRAYVQLMGTSQSMTWTNNTGQNITAFNIRYCVPPTADGTGATYTLDLYVNGTFRQTVSMNSKQTWVYTNGSGWGRTPSFGSGPYDYFDEVHAFITGTPLAPGSTITLQQDSTNTASFYYIDLIDLETPPPALTQPPNSLSVVTYGADPTGATDSTTAIQNCFTAANTSGQVVWIPPGTFVFSSEIAATNITVEGAGPWYTELNRIPLAGGGRNQILVNGATFENLYFNANDTYRGQEDYGINVEGNNWLISNVWVEHPLIGVIAQGTNGTLQNSRINNTFADGINLSNGHNNVDANNTIENTFVRGTGDDGISLDPSPGYSNSQNVTAINNTSECNWWANSLRMGGGVNETVENNLLQDDVGGYSLLVQVWTNLQSGIVKGNVLVRGGSTGGPSMLIGENGTNNGTVGASGVNANMDVESNTVISPYNVGIWVSAATDLYLANNIVTSPGTTGIFVSSNANGNAIFNNNTVTNLQAGQVGFFNDNPLGFLIDTTSAAANSAVEAASYDSAYNLSTQSCSEGGLNLDGIAAGSYTVYNNVNLDGVTSFAVRYADFSNSGSTTLEIHLDSATGTLIGTCTLPWTDGSQSWANATCTLSGAGGVHNIYLVNPTGHDHNIEWFAFQANTGTTEGASYNSVSNIGTQNCSEGGLNLNDISTGSYAVYNQIDLNGATAFTARVASGAAVGATAGTIGIYLDSPTGTLIGTCPVTGAGGWSNWTNVSCVLNGATGYHNVYLVFSGGTYFCNLEWFSFNNGEGTTTEAASYNSVSGNQISTQTCSEGGLNLDFIQNGNYAVYNNVDCNSLASFTARVASTPAVGQTAGTIGIHLDSPTGTQVGTLTVPGTGGWQTWTTASCPLSGASGYHNVYLVFTGGGSNMFNFEWFALTKGPQAGVNAIAGASYSSTAGASTENCAEGGLDLDSIENGDNAVYNQVNLTGMTNFTARVAALIPVGQTAGTIGIYLDSPTGTQIGTMTVPGTGGWQNWTTQSCLLNSSATGYHNIYLVFSGGSGNLYNLQWFEFQSGTTEYPGANYTTGSGNYNQPQGGGSYLGNIQNGNSVTYDGVDLTGATTFTANMAGYGGGTISIYLGSPTGTLLGTCNVSSTGGWNTYANFSCPLSNVPAGPQNVCLVFSGSGYNLNWFSVNNVQ
jgi:hypothetical protein